MLLPKQAAVSFHNKLTVSPFLLILISSLFITLSCNITFFDHLLDTYNFAENVGFCVALFLLIFALIAIILSLCHLIMPLKWALGLLITISVCCAYFSDSFGIIIDTDMIRNTLQTDIGEASDLINFNFVFRLIALALLPCLLIFYVKLQPNNQPKWLVKLKTTGSIFLLSVLLIGISIGIYSAQFSSFIRQHKQVRYYINPIQLIFSGFKYLNLHFAANQDTSFKNIANYADVPATDPRRELIIMVVGETARADHFSLNGYHRNTNPQLSQEANVINYSNIRSCGTSTAISVPCMFSLSSRDEFDVSNAPYTENAFDIIAKSDVSVLWRDNNSDSKGVAIRQKFEDFRSEKTNKQCDDECRDVGMLDGLQTYIDQQTHDVLIVLHQMGSHGPAYFKRYPKEFEKFTPACQTAELANCSQEEIINAYDNSILYTDHFLSQVIALLKDNDAKFQTTMLYVSDHGESLGENGIYLHGLPYAFAPDNQTHVPVVLWTNEASDVDIEATRNISAQPNSHDAVAKTLITLFEIESDAALGDAPNLIKFKANHY